MRWLMVAGLSLSSVMGFMPMAHAGLLSGTADFSESLDLPNYSSSGALVLGRTGAAIDGSVQLSAANTLSNPSGWTSAVNASLGDLLLTLTPDSTNTYQTITFTVTNILAAGAVITGFVQTGFGAIDPAASGAYTEALSFTADSLSVSYAVNDPASRAVFQFSSGGSDTFAITTSAVTEPASLLLLGTGLALLALRRRAGARA